MRNGSQYSKAWFILLIALLGIGCGRVSAPDSGLKDDRESRPFPADSRIAQNYVLFAYKNIGQIIENCLNVSFDPCVLTPREEHLLRAILRTLPQEYQSENQIEFRSGTEDPGFFFLDGNVRIAKTFDAVGDKIYFNQDLLYQPGPGARPEPVELGSLVAMIVHELGHHHEADPPYSHAELDLLGSRVRENNARKMVFLQDDDGELLFAPAVVAVNGDPKKFQPSRLWFVGTSELTDMTNDFLEQGRCPADFPYSNQYSINFPIQFSFHYAGISGSTPRKSLAVQAYGDMACHSKNRDGTDCYSCLRVLVPSPPKYDLVMKLKADPLGAGANLESFSLWVTHRRR